MRTAAADVTWSWSTALRAKLRLCAHKNAQALMTALKACAPWRQPETHVSTDGHVYADVDQLIARQRQACAEKGLCTFCQFAVAHNKECVARERLHSAAAMQLRSLSLMRFPYVSRPASVNASDNAVSIRRHEQR